MENGEIVRLVFNYVRTGASASQNVWHGEYNGGSTSDADYMEDLAAWLLDTGGPLEMWESIASNTVTLQSLTGDVMNLDGTVLRNLPEEFLNLPGGVLFDSMAAATSGQILFQTNVPGHRGMKYVPGLADPRVNLGLLDATATVNLIVFGLRMLALASAGTGVSTLLGVLSLATEEFLRFQVSSSSDTNPIYQRRRGPGRGL